MLNGDVRSGQQATVLTSGQEVGWGRTRLTGQQNQSLLAKWAKTN